MIDKKKEKEASSKLKTLKVKNIKAFFAGIIEVRKYKSDSVRSVGYYKYISRILENKIK